MSLNLALILRESAKKNPDHPAVILDSYRFTYGQLEALSNQVASTLKAAGLKKGDRVALMLPNVPQFPMAYFGILKAGGIVVPINVLSRAPEVSFFMGDSESRFLIVWEDFAAEAIKGIENLKGITTYVALKPGSSAPPAGTKSFMELMAGEPKFDIEPTSADDTATILYTSGTTGKPKGAELTHSNLFMNCHFNSLVFNSTPADVTLCVLPMFHSFGQSSVMNVAIHVGSTLTLVPRFDTDKVLEVIQRDKVTVFPGVPTMFFALLHHPSADKYDTSSLRICVSGGASLPGEVMQAFEKKFGPTILEGYGLSETSPTATFNISAERRKFLSIGIPMFGVELKIFDESDKELPAGKDHVGEIVIRGHNVMKGYWKKPEATAEAFKGGWFHTGDLGYVDEQGYYFIVDRKKEMIIRGGFNVYPREVEEVIYAHPAVAEAAVIGVPDERLGEEVKAVVSLKPGAKATEADIIEFVKERLAAYKYPRTVQFVDTLPKGATGKILKKELKAQLEATTRA
ncbi:MAG TPA: long-chain fatty acid--CoA ligase [Candidatus Dormibacteraeota bacterium]|nr:long-chain fatty acid--CoA ligase [Candidatus Dormibacteraeota bacterium]